MATRRCYWDHQRFARRISQSFSVSLVTPAAVNVVSISARTLIVQLHQIHESGVWDVYVTRFVNQKLLMIDDFGYLTLQVRTSHLLFQLTAAKYDFRSILPTSKQSLADRWRVLGRVAVVTKILEQIL